MVRQPLTHDTRSVVAVLDDTVGNVVQLIQTEDAQA